MTERLLEEKVSPQNVAEALLKDLVKAQRAISEAHQTPSDKLKKEAADLARREFEGTLQLVPSFFNGQRKNLLGDLYSARRFLSMPYVDVMATVREWNYQRGLDSEPIIGHNNIRSTIQYFKINPRTMDFLCLGLPLNER